VEGIIPVFCDQRGFKDVAFGYAFITKNLNLLPQSDSPAPFFK
jgi:hypothetical protein